MTLSSINAFDLNFKYQYNDIITDISFEIPQGKITAIVGRNGTGKSTILKLLAGLLVPQSGKICIGNQELNTLTRKDISKSIAYLGQTNTLAFDLTVAELLQLGVSVISGHGMNVSNESVNKAVRSYGLNDLLNSRISSLSGGERQNAFLAFTMLRKPSYLLLDEPTNHLDIANQLEFLSKLRFLVNSKDLTVVIVLHDLNHAIKFSDYVILVKSHREVKCGSPIHILQPLAIKESMSANSEILVGSDSSLINFLANGSIQYFQSK